VADLNALKQKYDGVITALEGFSDVGATVDTVDLDGDKLHLKATVPSKVVANRIWDIIKETDSTYSDLHHEITTSGGDEQAYTVKSGESLSKIAKRFYGEANDYNKIAEANHIDDPNRIQVGEELTLPVLS
jgi:nucleoid-associated protein YgaU